MLLSYLFFFRGGPAGSPGAGESLPLLFRARGDVGAGHGGDGVGADLGGHHGHDRLGQTAAGRVFGDRSWRKDTEVRPGCCERTGSRALSLRPGSEDTSSLAWPSPNRV